MPGRGGWFKMYDDELEDPKVEVLTDSEYRVWHACLKLCNRSPARLRERGYLYHSKGFPVTPDYIARRLLKPPEEVQAALDRLCEVGGPSSLMLVEDGDGGRVYRVRAWRKRQSGDDEEDTLPEKLPKSSQGNPRMSRPDVDVDRDVDIDKKQHLGASRKRSRPKSKPRKLTDEQNAWKQGRIDYWQRCLDVYYDAPKGEHQRFPDAGHAVKLFSNLAKGGKHKAERVDEAIRLFFKRRSDYREEKRAQTPSNKVPPAVPVKVKDFDALFDEMYDLAKVER